MAYRNQPADPAAEPEIIEELQRGVDVVTLTSASAARNYSDLVDKYALPFPPVVACIGPETARVAVIKGLPVHVVATVHTAEGLLDAIEAYMPLEDT